MHDSSLVAIPNPDRSPIRAIPWQEDMSRLPRPLTTFLGRSRDLATILDLLARDSVRLMTLVGPGGVGKTRLAIEIASAMERQFPDGAEFVSLAAVRDPAAVGEQLARSFRHESRLSRVGDQTAHLRDIHGLLVLDNFEHVVAAAPTVARFLAECPHLKILVTSRQLLEVSGEQVYIVPPLGLPDRIDDLTKLGSSAAVQLLVERARSRDVEFGLTPANASSLVDICRMLDGLPLAIELAAALVSNLGPTILHQRLERRLHILTRNTIDAPDRHRTMRDAIGWGFDLLDERLRVAFRRLAVFVGGFTLEAAEAVLGDLGNVVDILGDLAARSLLVQRPSGEGETRFLMLETIREFGLETLAASGDRHATRDRHAAWIRTVAERSEWAWFMPLAEGEVRLAELEREHANIHEVLTWLASQAATETIIEIASVLGGLWCVLGYGTQGRYWLDPARDVDVRLAPSTRAKALATLSWITNMQGKGAHAQDLAEASLSMMNDESPLYDRIYALVLAGVAARKSGDSQHARRRLQEAKDCLAGLESEAWTWNWGLSTRIELGLAALMDGDVAFAEQTFHGIAGDQVARQGEVGMSHPYGTHVLSWLGDCERAKGNHTAAMDYYRRNIKLLHRFGNALYLCYDLCGIAAALANLGQLDAAARLFGAAEACHIRFGFSFERESFDRQRALGLPEPWARESDSCSPWDALREAVRARRSVAPIHVSDPERAAQGWEAGRSLDLADAVAEALAANDAPAQPVRHSLTTRELGVLRLLVEGKSDLEIAEALFISRRTVASHIRNIYEKLGVSTRTEAAVWAVRNAIA